MIHRLRAATGRVLLFAVAAAAGVSAPVLAVFVADTPALVLVALGFGPAAAALAGWRLRRPAGERWGAVAVALACTLIVGLVIVGAASSGLHESLDP